MSQSAATVEEIKQLLTDEREHTRTMIHELRQEVADQFMSFITNNFNPAMASIDWRFDKVEDHLDRLDIDVAGLRTDMRHVKQVLQISPHVPRAT